MANKYTYKKFLKGIMTGTQILHYKIISKLGEGGMGVVYLAEDIKLDRKVALKFLPHFITTDSQQRERFKLEAKAAAALNHKNISIIYAIEETQDQAFIVMEYIDGIELGHKLKAGPIKEDEAWVFAIQIAEGLEAAHSKGIVHRDIKSSNIMITGNNLVKVMDFGLAKIGSITPYQDFGLTSGTLAYMSPEQARGDNIDHRTDIWSFGVLMYEMLAGNKPFSGHYEQSLFYSIMSEEPDLSGISKNISTELSAIILKCLIKDTDYRYQNFTDVISDLKKAKEIQPFEFILDNKPPKMFSKYKLLLALAAGFLLLICAVFFLPIAKFADQLLGKVPEFSKQHLSILPLVQYGNDSTVSVLSDGLMETMTSKITQLEQLNNSLWVVPSSEVLSNQVRSPGEAKELFGVNLVITGALQNLNNKIRLTLNLVDTKNMRQLNSSVIDVNNSDISELQNVSIIRLIEMLDLELNPKTHEIISEGNTRVPEAYKYFLQGRGFLLRYENLENINSSIHMFRSAIDEDSLYALAYASLAEAFWQKYESTKDLKLLEAALSNSEKAYNIDSNLVAVNVTSGLIYSGIGRIDEARNYFTKALDLDPMNAAAYRGLANCYERKNENEKAESTYKKAIALKPDYWAGYNALGSFYYNYSRYEEAVKQFEKVIELTPDNTRGYNNAGAIYYYLESWKDAQEMFEKSLSISQSYTVASNLGTLYFIQKKYLDAERMYETALTINDKDYVVWGNLASARYWIPGKRESAIRTYNKAISILLEQEKINPENPSLISDLASYYSMTGENEKALNLVKKSVRLAPGDVQVIFRAGSTYEQLGDRNQAIFYLERALKKGYSASEMQNQPDLSNVLSDERFKKILKRYE